jgi:cytochrome c-type biogenesis protein CcmH/NrfG
VSSASFAESARAAWHAAHPLWREVHDATRRDGAVVPAEPVARAWRATVSVLQTLAPEAAPDDVKAQVAALRQLGVCTLDEAHALIDLDVFVRQLTADGAVAHHASDATRLVLSRGEAAVERLVQTADAASVSVPLAAEYSRTAARNTTAGTADVRTPRADAPPPPPPSAANRRARSSAFVVGLVVVCFGAAAIAAVLFSGVGRRDALQEGIAAYEAGQRMVARLAFERAAVDQPADARPLVYLGRLAREEGDLRTSRRLLEQAVQRDAEYALAHRELASALLADGQPELARRFYVRALGLDADDRVAQGFLGCALARLGRFDEANRWVQRAGPGDWSACVTDARALSPAVLPSAPPGGP